MEMSKQSIPKRLRKDPILEALCEIRFSGNGALGSLLPGLLLPKLRELFPNFEKLPASSIPEQIRSTDPNLQYVHLYRLAGPSGMVLIGDRVLSVAVGGSYPGWGNFRPLAMTVFGAALETGLLGGLDRLSVKYVNVLQTNEPQPISKLAQTVVVLGEAKIQDEPLQLRVEFKANDHVTVVQLANPATIDRPGLPSVKGCVIDIDTIRMLSSNVSNDLGPLLDAAHDEEKRIFYTLLSEQSLQHCEPEYA